MNNKESNNLLFLLENAGKNFIESFDYANKNEMENNQYDGNVILIGGMGGSGISGDYIKLLSLMNGGKLVLVNKTYEVNYFDDIEYIPVIISYSGNTEETITMLHNILKSKKSKKPIIITSGGRLKEIADEQNLNQFLVPPNLPQRMAFPYIFGTLSSILKNFCKIPNFSEEMISSISKSSHDLPHSENLMTIATQIKDNFPMIIVPNILECVGNRFRTQLNENSKLFAATFLSPEFSHNGVIGFDNVRNKKLVFILIFSKYQSERSKIHMEFIKSKCKESNIDYFEIKSDEQSYLQELLHLTWIIDYISIKIAELEDINPAEIKSITELKQILKNS